MMLKRPQKSHKNGEEFQRAGGFSGWPEYIPLYEHIINRLLHDMTIFVCKKINAKCRVLRNLPGKVFNQY